MAAGLVGRAWAVAGSRDGEGDEAKGVPRWGLGTGEDGNRVGKGDPEPDCAIGKSRHATVTPTPSQIAECVGIAVS